MNESFYNYPDVRFCLRPALHIMLKTLAQEYRHKKARGLPH